MRLKPTSGLAGLDSALSMQCGEMLLDSIPDIYRPRQGSYIHLTHFLGVHQTQKSPEVWSAPSAIADPGASCCNRTRLPQGYLPLCALRGRALLCCPTLPLCLSNPLTGLCAHPALALLGDQGSVCRLRVRACEQCAGLSESDDFNVNRGENGL